MFFTETIQKPTDASGHVESRPVSVTVVVDVHAESGFAEYDRVIEAVPELHEITPEPEGVVDTELETSGPTESHPLIVTVPELHVVDVNPESEHSVDTGMETSGPAEYDPIIKMVPEFHEIVYPEPEGLVSTGMEKSGSADPQLVSETVPELSAANRENVQQNNEKQSSEISTTITTVSSFYRRRPKSQKSTAAVETFRCAGRQTRSIRKPVRFRPD